MDISCDTEHLLYEYGYDAYTHSHFQKAVAVFRFLILLNPNEGRTWFALGSALMMLSQDSDTAKQAIQAFTIAEMHAPNDVRPHLFKAECLIRCGNKADAKIALAKAESKLQSSEKEKELFQNQIELIKMYLQK